MALGVGSPSWATNDRWQVLDTHFGDASQGLDGLERFLSTWQTWRTTAKTPPRLFYTALLPLSPPAEALAQRLAVLPPALHPLGQQLFESWKGLLPGVHRLVFENDALHLTLCIGPGLEHLAGLDTAMNQIVWAAAGPAVHEPAFDEQAPKQLARLSQPGTLLAVEHPTTELLARLATAGFKATEDLSTGAAWRGVYAPHWPVRNTLRGHAGARRLRVVVVGGGLSGSAVAYSLAQRGCHVEVVDAAEQPAAGASGLPVGLVAPHVSPDDSALSRITRAGVASTLPRLAGLLQAGQDWAHSGVLEHRLEGKRGLPGNALWTPPESPGAAWSTVASPEQKAAAQLPDTAQALWHKQAAWLKPRALVQAHLAHPNITWQGATRVEAIERMVGGWRLRGFCGVAAEPWVCEAETVVLASAFNTLALLNTLGLQAPLNALRGQVTWGTVSSLPAHTAPFLPPFPVNGHGSFIHGMDFGLPATAHGPCWAVGSTFERGVTDPHILPADQVANKARLARLLPHVHSQCEPGMDAAFAWAGVRCTVPDRLPMVGFLAPESWPGLMVCAGMGARGLTLSVLCGEVLAAQYFGEPWPLERKLACALLAHRFAAKRV